MRRLSLSLIGLSVLVALTTAGASQAQSQGAQSQGIEQGQYVPGVGTVYAPLAPSSATMGASSMEGISPTNSGTADSTNYPRAVGLKSDSELPPEKPLLAPSNINQKPKWADKSDYWSWRNDMVKNGMSRNLYGFRAN
jgi:hypothetical protein